VSAAAKGFSIEKSSLEVDGQMEVAREDSMGGGPVGSMNCRGYADAQARHIFRDLIDMPATVDITSTGVNVHFHRRAHLPIIIASGLLNTPVVIPWWNNLPLTLTA
jgi:hypothetical protein